MPQPLDTIIIGAGTAGLAALREVRKRTDRYLIVNEGPWGTTCARVGCMPSKALIEAANAFHRRHSFEEFGLRGASALTADLPAVLQRVRALRDDFVAGATQATDGLGSAQMSGRATLLGPRAVDIDGTAYATRSIIIATGSRPRVPDEWLAFGDRMLTTDTLFEQPSLGPRVAVIGMGPIGVELSQALARLGLEVAAFTTGHTLAGLSDPTLNAELAEAAQPVVVNLASEEYFKAVCARKLAARVIQPVFEDWKGGRYKIISFYAKKARGLMARYAVVNRLSEPEALQAFDCEGYAFTPEVSDAQTWVFRRRQA